MFKNLLPVLFACLPLQALGAPTFDAASAFGVRESVTQLTLSPNGQTVAYIAPADGQGTVLLTMSLANKSVSRSVMRTDGKPFRLRRCNWVSNTRLVCNVFGIIHDPVIGLAHVTRIVAFDADGSNVQVLSNRTNEYSRGYLLGGGQVIDWLPDQDGAVLMSRDYVPDDHLGSHVGSTKEGLGVDWIDTRTLAIKEVEPPRRSAVEYLSDGRGTIRVMGLSVVRADGMEKGTITYEYRTPGSREWHKLGDYNEIDDSGFLPEAVDPTLNVAYGFKKKDGREALYSVTLDGSLHEELVFARPDVDVSGLIRIGRRQRVVGASYITDTGYANYIAPEIEALARSLAKALPQEPLIQIADSSVDENTLLVFGGSDTDPGVYFILDRKAHNLQTFLVVRDRLENVQLANQKAVSYPAADGVMIPGYLTLPPGQESAKGLPAIVMPHGGPSSRDTWGFQWLAQFYASRGFAILQPNFRGSSGYGDTWLEQNGFKSWRIAIGDITAGGHWLVSQGVADPAKLAIVGWSYGGYAALQSAVVDPTLFKAVVAIAPVTDFAMLKEERRHWTDFEIVSQYIGDGPHVREGSPAEHADGITAPVLLFHGTFDRNVGIEQSKHMAVRLTAAGKPCKLVTWEGLDHQIEDSTAREQMLRTSDEFLRQALGITMTAAKAP